QSAFLIDELVKDIEQDLFKNFTTYVTSFNVTLVNVNDAVKYLTMHEGLHLGYAMAIKRLIKN
ncbi:MAG: DinB family protein, partial [Bacteroidia bacterium]|nr:DinB family protein [Bacteroidia bacterium]